MVVFCNFIIFVDLEEKKKSMFSFDISAIWLYLLAKDVSDDLFDCLPHKKDFFEQPLMFPTIL